MTNQCHDMSLDPISILICCWQHSIRFRAKILGRIHHRSFLGIAAIEGFVHLVDNTDDE